MLSDQTSSATLFSVGILGSLFALWCLHRWVTREEKSRLRRRLEACMAERERRAEEVNDAMLQGFHGLMLQFQTATERIPDGSPARALMEAALDRADVMLLEQRHRLLERHAGDSSPYQDP